MAVIEWAVAQARESIAIFCDDFFYGRQDVRLPSCSICSDF